MSLILKDNEGNPCPTTTVFIYGCVVCVIKLALSGSHIAGILIPSFGGSEFGIAIGALGGIYSLQNHVKNLGKEKE